MYRVFLQPHGSTPIGNTRGVNIKQFQMGEGGFGARPCEQVSRWLSRPAKNLERTSSSNHRPPKGDPKRGSDKQITQQVTFMSLSSHLKSDLLSACPFSDPPVAHAQVAVCQIIGYAN